MINFGSGGGNEVKMNGSGEVANFKESSGLHFLEIETPKGGSDGWSILEIGFVVLVFKLELIVTHGLHYCLVTKKHVKKRVKKSMDFEMMKLTQKPPAVSGIVKVPGLWAVVWPIQGYMCCNSVASDKGHLWSREV